jgi:hypothetical protein
MKHREVDVDVPVGLRASADARGVDPDIVFSDICDPSSACTGWADRIAVSGAFAGHGWQVSSRRFEVFSR